MMLSYRLVKRRHKSLFLTWGLFAILVAGFCWIKYRQTSLHLVWSDDFNGSSIDRSKWNVRNEAGRYNHELQYYSPRNVMVQDGHLRLTSQQALQDDHSYLSGAVDSKSKYFFVYGKVEVRARFPRGQGVWPAVWLLPEDGSWPPEIDIAELVGQEPTSLMMTNHWGTWQQHEENSGIYRGSDFTQNWHTYAVDWEPGRIRWLVDGKERFTSTKNVSGKPMYLILNTAIGGDLPGQPGSGTVFPQYHDVDYVRIWQRR